MSITQAQTQALASFISRVRPDWDHPGIVAAITKAGPLGNPADIGTALCRLATNHELRTPAILASEGPHWRDTQVAARVWPVMCELHPDVRASRCDVDGPCRNEVVADVGEVRRAAAAVKAALAAGDRPRATGSGRHDAARHGRR